MTPKGAAPIIIGMMSRAPAVNSLRWFERVKTCLLEPGSIAGEARPHLYVLADERSSRSLPASGRHAEHAPEVPREMALVGKAAGGGYIGDGNARAQRRKRALQPHLVAPRVRREASRAVKE